jgi:hypothetical protein
MECLRLIPLAGGTGAHEVTNDHGVMVHHEVKAEALQGRLDSFMPGHVCELEHRHRTLEVVEM